MFSRSDGSRHRPPCRKCKDKACPESTKYRPGGLWVNWRYGTRPLQTNVNGTGEPDDTNVSPPRHDELTDLRYIHNLWSYKRQNPADTSFNREIARYTPIIKREFAHSHNERGWLYDEASALLATWYIRSLT
jgi:hypothetical protein